MMRMVMEVVMVLAVVGGMFFVMKVSAAEKENNTDIAPPDNEDKGQP